MFVMMEKLTLSLYFPNEGKTGRVESVPPITVYFIKPLSSNKMNEMFHEYKKKRSDIKDVVGNHVEVSHVLGNGMNVIKNSVL